MSYEGEVKEDNRLQDKICKHKVYIYLSQPACYERF